MQPRARQPEARGRLAIIAGRGRLPLDIAAAARAAGDDPFVIGLKGEARDIPDEFEHAFIGVGDASGVHRILKDHGVDRVVMSGGVDRRPELAQIRAPFHLIPAIPRMLRILKGSGDDTLLRAVIAIIEGSGCRVVGAQEIVPDLLAQIGSLTKQKPSKTDWGNIRVGFAGADMLGRLDVGQGAVAVGGRIVALEGPEGTDAMLSRVADMRKSGRISQRRKGVLIKLCKPQQDERADLPSIGLVTIDHAVEAGLAGIAIEAGRAFILDQQEAMEKANAAGIFVIGIDRDEMAAMARE
jgi:hypothetical protein